MVTKTIDLQQTPLSIEELLALVKQDTLIVLKEGDQEVARLSPPLADTLPEDVEARVKLFREAARDIGEEIAKSGLSEDELMQLLEETRQEVFEERYGKRATR